MNYYLHEQELILSHIHIDVHEREILTTLGVTWAASGRYLEH